MRDITTIGIFTYGVAVPTDQGWRVNESLGRLVDGVARRYTKVVAVFAAPGEESLAQYRDAQGAVYRYELQSGNVELKTIPLARNNRPVTLFLSAWRRITELYRLVRGCDFVYLFVPGVMGLTVAMLCVLLRKPYGAYFGADWLENARFRADWGRFGRIWQAAYRTFAGYAERYVARRAAFVLVTGRAYLPRLRSYNTNVHETVLMSNFDKADFRRNDGERSSGRKRVILFVGPVTERKGVLFLVRALALLPAHGIPLDGIELRLAGTLHEDYWAQVRAAAEQAQVSHLVHSLGYVSDKTMLLNLYREADVLAVPSLAEGFPRVIYEAMTQRVPVVATAIASIRETLGDSGAVQLARPEDPESLANKIACVLKDEPLRSRMVAEGMDIAERKVGGDPAGQVAQLIEYRVR